MQLFLDPGEIYGPAELIADLASAPIGEPITVKIDESGGRRTEDYLFAYQLLEPPAEPITFDVAPGVTLTLEAGSLLLSGSLAFSGL